MTTSTRDRLLKAADDLFYRDGFHAVGLDRLLDDAGVTKTTFYNHFESKEALILALLQARDRWWREEFVRLLQERGGAEPRGQIAAIVDVLEHLFNSGRFNGCIFVKVLSEFPLPTDPVHRAAGEHKGLMEMILRDLALRAGARDPVAFAEQLAMLMEGAYVTHQVSNSPRTAAIARRTAQLLIDQHLPTT